MKRVAIIGGGIAGLTAAYYLEKTRREGAALEWTLFEKSDRLGGVIRTEHRDGYVLEAGPDSFLTIKPDGAQLCRDLGIAGDLISSNDAERKTYIVVKGRLVPIPDGLQFMVPRRVWPMITTPLFSWGTKLKMAAELFSSAGTDRGKNDRGNNDRGNNDRRSEDGGGDESVGDFVRRHFGQQMVDRVAEPLLAGVYGGNADQLSVRAVLARFVEMEREHGSLVRATLRARQRASSHAAAAPTVGGQSGSAQATQPQPLFTSLKSGMQQMVDALLAALPQQSLRLRQQTIALNRTGNAWQVETRPTEMDHQAEIPREMDPASGTSQRFDAVVLAVPAQASAAILKPLHAALAGDLARIDYTSSVAVALAYDRLDLAQLNLPAGHGFLVPRTEGRKMLACTFVHKKFPYRAPEGAALLRCFFSSARVPDLLTCDDQALEATARKELQEILGLAAQPRFTRVFRWEYALPQYETGHLDRVAQMEQSLAELPGLEIIGNSFHGIGVPDCIRSARQAAAKIAEAALQPASV